MHHVCIVSLSHHNRAAATAHRRSLQCRNSPDILLVVRHRTLPQVPLHSRLILRPTMPSALVRLCIRHLRRTRVHPDRRAQILVLLSRLGRRGRLLRWVGRELGGLYERDLVGWAYRRDRLFFGDCFGVVEYILYRFWSFFLYMSALMPRLRSGVSAHNKGSSNSAIMVRHCDVGRRGRLSRSVVSQVVVEVVTRRQLAVEHAYERSP